MTRREGGIRTVKQHRRDLLFTLAIEHYWHSPKAIQFLHENALDVNKVDEEGFTPLIRAIRHGEAGAFHAFILLYCADPNVVDAKYGESPLWWAIREKQDWIADVLREKGAREESKSWGNFDRPLLD